MAVQGCKMDGSDPATSSSTELSAVKALETQLSDLAQK